MPTKRCLGFGEYVLLRFYEFQGDHPLIIYCYQSQNFDDGPTKAGIQLYDYLKSINQKASLFYIGLMVAQYPAYAKRACDE